MADTTVKLTIPYYPNPSASRALASASIYVGDVDTDPTIAGNQKDLYVLEEDGSTTQITQPATTNAGGQVVYNGSPVTLLCTGAYSLTVLDSSGTQQYHIPNCPSDVRPDSLTVADLTIAANNVLLGNDNGTSQGGQELTATEVRTLLNVEDGSEANNISDANATDLTDAGDTTLHYHAADRARANHTGTQTASTISDFDTEVSNNTDVASNTTHRSSDGKNHSDVVLNNTHRTSTGADHTYIDQDVTSGSAPTFTADNFSDGGSNAIITTTQETNFESAYTHISNNGSDHSYIDQDVTSGSSPTLDAANITGSPTFTTVTATTSNATTFDTNVTAAGLTLAGTTLAADGTDTHIDITVTPKGNAGIVIPNLGSAPAVTTNKLYQVSGVVYFDGNSLEGGGASASDAAYTRATWNGDTTDAATKNAISDALYNMVRWQDADTGGTGCTFVGGTGNTTNSGDYNTFVGVNAGAANTSGTVNIFTGVNAGAANTVGLRQNVFGVNALTTMALQGDDNCAFGYESLRLLNHANADKNCAFGNYSGDAMTQGYQNALFGYASGGAITTGNNNTYIGNNSGEKTTTGYNNTFLGTESGGEITTGSGMLCLGSSAGPTTNQSDQLYIDYIQTDTPLIYGHFANNIVGIHGQLVIGAKTGETNLGSNNLQVDGGVISLVETTTPTADVNYGKIYTKSDNKLYFQDGGGTEHEIAFV